MVSFNFNYLLKTLSLNIVILRVRAATDEFGGGVGEEWEHNSVHGRRYFF